MLNTNVESKQIINLPNHVAIIMDGNGRWAKKRFLPRIAGHKKAIASVRFAIEFCIENNISYLTLFAFSTENWQRPKLEVNALMDLFLVNLKKEFSTLENNNVRLNIIGDKSKLSFKLQQEISNVETKTKNNNKLILNLAINYGGKDDIVNACKQIAIKVNNNELDINELDSEKFREYLYLHDQPDPDLLIRTSGESRISNFLLWNLAYSELYFTDVLWPDFTKQHFNEVLNFYCSRKRRFGLTDEQI